MPTSSQLNTQPYQPVHSGATECYPEAGKGRSAGGGQRRRVKATCRLPIPASWTGLCSNSNGQPKEARQSSLPPPSRCTGSSPHKNLPGPDLPRKPPIMSETVGASPLGADIELANITRRKYRKLPRRWSVTCKAVLRCVPPKRVFTWGYTPQGFIRVYPQGRASNSKDLHPRAPGGRAPRKSARPGVSVAEHRTLLLYCIHGQN